MPTTINNGLRIREAEMLSGYCDSHLRRLLLRGDVRGIKSGRDWFVDEASLREYMATPHKTGPKS